jgi:hypothetical protein
MATRKKQWQTFARLLRPGATISARFAQDSFWVSHCPRWSLDYTNVLADIDS